MAPTGREKEAERRFDEGEVIIREGEDGREMFVIQSGRVRVCSSRDGQEIELAVLERGDFFGEMSLLESLPRSATVTALTKTTVLVIHPGTLLLRIRRDPTFAFELLHRMSRKLRAINEQILELRTEDGSVSGSGTEKIIRTAVAPAAPSKLSSRRKQAEQEPAA